MSRSLIPRNDRLFSIHRNIHFGIIFFPARQDVGEPRRAVHDLLDLPDDLPRFFQIIAVDLDVHGRRRAEAHDALDDAPGVRDHLHARRTT